MKKIDVSNIQTVKALHIYLAYALELPEHYGRNLDALQDILSERGETIEVIGAPASEEMAAYMARLRRMLSDMD